MSEFTEQTDTERPNAARMYDYMLGGAANFGVDREAVKRQLATVPETREWAIANRRFLGRAVQYMANAGVDQFLDLGSGVPTMGNVSEVAHSVNPEARVAYVDIEPVAVAHAQRILAEDGRVTISQADIRDPAEVLSAPAVDGLLDFSRPVGVIACAILHFVRPPHDPHSIVAAYRDACTADSYLVVSHWSTTTLSAKQSADSYSTYDNTATPARPRSHEEIRSLFDGYTILDPGVALVPEWRPDEPVSHEQALRTNCYAGVGVLP